MLSADNDNNIREYLLGRLSEEDREEFARRFFTDEELFDKLEAAEGDLIDDYLSGDLSPGDIEMFRQNFMIGSKRERALRIGQAWRNAALKKPPKPVSASHWWPSFSDGGLRIGDVAVFSPAALRI